MNFSRALEAMEAGYKVSRAGWNGKGMWICKGDGQVSLPASKFWNPHTRAFAEQNGGTADVLPYFIMKTADDKILMGWLASQTDMLATDWGILDEHGRHLPESIGLRFVDEYSRSPEDRVHA